MKIRDDLTEEELKKNMVEISATITKRGMMSFEITIDSITQKENVGVLIFKQEVRKRWRLTLISEIY